MLTVSPLKHTNLELSPDFLLCRCRVNPAPYGWPHETGQDFLPNHMADGIDFASMHL